MTRIAMILAVSLSTVALAQQHLDLTKVEVQGAIGLLHDKETRSAKSIQLPVEITLERLWPLSIVGRDHMEVDVKVRNLGKDTLAIPVTQDYEHVYRIGNQGIKSMAIALLLTLADAPSGTPPVTDYVGFGHGSTSVPASLIFVEPNETVSIRVSAELPEARNAWRNGQRALKIRAQAAYSEMYIDGADLKIWNSSVQAVSANSIEFTLAWPARP
jgi:hypothetical protein